MMREMPTLGFVDPDSAHRRMAKTAAEIELVAWLRAQARDRTPDGKRGGPCWYLVTVRPGTEVAMAIRLLRDRQMAFCPREKVVQKKPRGNGTHTVRRPMYPGYLFVQLAPAEISWAGILTYDGIGRMLPASDRPARMSDAAMAEIRGVARKKPHRKSEAPTLFVAGDKVLIKAGPFVDFEGKVLSAEDAGGRLVVEVTIFGGAVPAELGLDQVRKLR